MSLAYARISKADRPQKDEARREIIKQILQVKWPQKTVRLLTLPGAWWKFEKLCIDYRHRLRVSVTACEKEDILFRNAALRVPGRGKGLKVTQDADLKGAYVVTNRNNMTLINYDIAEFMKVARHQYDCARLDFCGPIGDRVIQCLNQVGRVLRTPALLILTFLKGREQQPYCDLVSENANGRIGFIEDAVKVMVGEEMNLISSREYQDSAPMVQMIFGKMGAKASEAPTE